MFVDKLTGSYIPLMRRVVTIVSILDVLYRQKKCTGIDAADGDTASRLIGRAGKVECLSGNGLTVSKRPSI